MIEKRVLKDMEQAFFVCTCGAEAIAISYDDDDFEQGTVRTIYLSTWLRGESHRSIRWHYIKRILKYGTPYLDEVCLTSAQARELGQLLIDLADEYSGT